MSTTTQTRPNDPSTVLFSLSRAAIMDSLRASDHPVPVSEVADAIGLHTNTARWHLDQLVDVGCVERIAESQGRRGRPRWLYKVATTSTAFPNGGREPDSGYRVLAEILADYLTSTQVDPTNAAISAGRTWGRRMVDSATPSGSLDTVEATRRVITLLDKLGFSPDVVDLDNSGEVKPITLRTCPFRDVAVQHAEIDILVGGLIEILQERHRGLAEVAVACDSLTQHEKADTEPVAASRRPFQRAPAHQLVRHAKRRRLRQPRALS